MIILHFQKFLLPRWVKSALPHIAVLSDSNFSFAPAGRAGFNAVLLKCTLTVMEELIPAL
jgi:hypothetical protein